MADWSLPTVTSLFTDWPTKIKERADSQAKMFDDGVSWTNLPSGTLKWSSSNDRFEKWNGATWANLSTSLTNVLKTANNLSDLTDVSTARTNLGLGSAALASLPLSIANGGTAGTTASTARTNLGLGSIATQNANTIAITGGSITGLGTFQMAASSTIDMVSNGTLSKVYYVTNSGDMIVQPSGGNYILYLGANSDHRLQVTSTTLNPHYQLAYDLGDASHYFRNAYIDQIISGKFYWSGDFNFQYLGTTYWVMGSSSKDFRPNTNFSQDLGFTNYSWATVHARRGYLGYIELRSTGDATNDGKIYYGTSSLTLLRTGPNDNGSIAICGGTANNVANGATIEVHGAGTGAGGALILNSGTAGAFPYIRLNTTLVEFTNCQTASSSGHTNVNGHMLIRVQFGPSDYRNKYVKLYD